MKNSKIILFVFLVLFFSLSPLSAQSDDCDGCKSDPSQCCDIYPELCSGSSPGGDNPDDNYSYSSFTPGFSTGGKGTVSILRDGHWKEAEIMSGDFSDNIDFVSISGSLNPRFVIIPSGALYGRENDLTFKYVLEQYLDNGGTVIVFAQQYGYQIESLLPVPEGETLKSYGWREDQSCLKNSIYFDTPHPALSSSTNQLLDAGVDGYFSVYPSNSTVLLRRSINREAALLYYPYGDNGGHVILTSMFTDWASAHSQATTSELKVIRDLITFARNPVKPIPMYDMDQTPTPGIQLTVNLNNTTTDPPPLRGSNRFLSVSSVAE